MFLLQDKLVTLENLTGCEFGQNGIEALAKALRSNVTLRHLGLQSNQLDDEEVRTLSEALKSNATLRHLCLQYNQIGDAGVQALAESLRSNAALRHLDLWNNRIGVAGAQALAKALERNATLRSVGLASNRIGDVGAEALFKGLESNATLRRLDLWNNRIGNVGAQTLAKALAKALTRNATLRRLDLGFNEIGNLGAEALAKALETNTALQYFHIRSNRIDISKSIETSIERNKCLRHICNRITLLECTRDVAIALRTTRMPMYVLLEIVEWKLALEMSNSELESVGKRLIATERHLQRCESQNRQLRAKVIDEIYRE